jgi:ABC-type spermidine/putrescine transport system permease subunit I
MSFAPPDLNKVEERIAILSCVACLKIGYWTAIYVNIHRRHKKTAVVF